MQNSPDRVAEAQLSNPALWASGADRKETPTDVALKALQKRPKFSIRMQIYVAVAVSFVIFFGVAMSLLITTYLIEHKVRFLEISNSYLFEIQQARRFEKNFFLYGTNMDEALENIANARQVLLENAEGLEGVMGEKGFSIILPRLKEYEDSLLKLRQSELSSGGDSSPLKKQAEAEVRRNGQEIVNFAEHLMQEEKRALDKMILLSRKVHIYSFVFLFCFFAFNTYFLGRRVLRPLWRFVAYAERIATGDYSPITPARRYRDEFSNLAVAINKMIREIEIKQDQLIQSHKVAAIGLLTSGVAHELNNPINNINITAEYILENYDGLDNQEKRRLLGEIMQQGDRASSTVKELLHFTRVKPDAFEQLDITSVIEDILRLLQNQMNLNGITVEKDYPPVVPVVNGNRNNLQQVFLNLLTNAIQAMPSGGKLRLVISDTHVGLLKIDVIDTGVGIKQEHLQLIFDPYFTTKNINEGTGLGLSVCFGIIKKHTGKIMVSSEVGKGSTFSVYLPCFSPDSSRGAETGAGGIQEISR
ncbi:MAG: sensor histidine kinase [Candidatus Abyssobacteria bacterium SURF_5]|uniref:histidine kinase n=1 Tax=Abyssobacteria bacterium (strain SURF_5) TaxID=2093360 RepID=A0A3A4NU93_ABYX5|nr:MAG: sensor histidine kinase [Candidatus Abyssubacteria bacterium SURF_5]